MMPWHVEIAPNRCSSSTKEYKMKITKTQLRTIIKEELDTVVKEQGIKGLARKAAGAIGLGSGISKEAHSAIKLYSEFYNNLVRATDRTGILARVSEIDPGKSRGTVKLQDLKKSLERLGKEVLGHQDRALAQSGEYGEDITNLLKTFEKEYNGVMKIIDSLIKTLAHVSAPPRRGQAGSKRSDRRFAEDWGKVKHEAQKAAAAIASPEVIEKLNNLGATKKKQGDALRPKQRAGNVEFAGMPSKYHGE